MRIDKLGLAGAALGAAAILLAASSASAAQAARQMPPGQVDPDRVNGAGRILEPTNDNRPFNPRDFSGVWRGGIYGFSRMAPDFTPEGLKRFEANKPSYGVPADSPEAKTSTNLHIGRRRAIPPALGNDPAGPCNPLGLIRAILYVGAGSNQEMVQTKDKLLQLFEWTWDFREVWLDGRKLPAKEDRAGRWNGYSTGHWEGDTLVVDTVGMDGRAWVDHFGYPMSDNATLQERWRRINASTLEINMTLTDPEIYKTPWQSDPNRYRLMEPAAGDVWPGLIEDKCVPLDNDVFIEKAVKPAAGVK